MLDVATASSAPAHGPAQVQRPNIVSVGTIVWLSNELMFFAALFAMYFTARSVWGASHPWPSVKLDVPFDTSITIVLVLSSVTCQLGVFAAERGDVRSLRLWYAITFIMGLTFVVGQGHEFAKMITDEGLTMAADPYGSVFYITTGFHGLHVCGGLIAFLFLFGRTYAARRFTHEQAISSIVVSYYWHFVDVVWIGLYTTIFLIQ
ncbi:MAG: aa3-type cytochrome oxidase subunit III [Streptosporangiaceae bacterium]